MTIAIVCYCPACDYFIKTAVQPDAVGSHGCVQCAGLMEVYIAQGSREVVKWHEHVPGSDPPRTSIPSTDQSC